MINLGTLQEGGKPVCLKIPHGEGFQLSVIGGSGSGKTHTLYRIIEQIPEKRPLFIADIEQDFLPLRRHRKLVVVGKGGDMPADPQIAPTLAKRFLESGFSILFNAFEEKRTRREEFLKGFLDALHDAPRNLWRPATILLDEIDWWAPERSERAAVSTESCGNAALRFRKRGFDLIMATTRIAAVDKTTISMTRNWVIGYENLDIDVKRSLSFLGFTEKEEKKRYMDLQRGEFFVHGPDFGIRRPLQMKVGPAPLYVPALSKKKVLKAPAPQGQLKKLITELKGLPDQAAEEIKDLESMRARIRELEREGRELRKGQPKKDPDAEKRAFESGRAAVMKEMTKMAMQIKGLRNKISAKLQELGLLVSQIPEIDQAAAAHTYKPAHDLAKSFVHHNERPRTNPPGPRQPKREPLEVATAFAGYLGRSERKILKFLALRSGKSFTSAQVGALTGFKHTGGSFNTYLSRLRAAGLIEGGRGDIRCADTERAAAVLGSEYSAPERSQLEAWLEDLGGGEKKIYQVVYQNPDTTFTKAELGEAVEMQPSGGSFNTYLSRLSTLGLIERKGDQVRLNPEVRDL